MKNRIESSPKEKEKTPSEVRLEMVGSAVDKIKKELSSDELEKLKAIIVYGSVARGTATDESDIDIHIDVNPYDSSTFKKILLILNEMPEDISVSSQNIIKGGRMAKLLVAQKYMDKAPAWKFLYSRSVEEQEELDRILKDTYLRRKKSEKSQINPPLAR